MITVSEKMAEAQQLISTGERVAAAFVLRQIAAQLEPELTALEKAVARARAKNATLNEWVSTTRDRLGDMPGVMERLAQYQNYVVVRRPARVMLGLAMPACYAVVQRNLIEDDDQIVWTHDEGVDIVGGH